MYKKVYLQPAIVINKIVTMYYLEFPNTFEFLGEMHDFWEILYIDRGEIEMTAGGIRHNMKQGSAIFLQPNEFHQFHTTRNQAINLVVVSFECRSRAMQAFQSQVIPLQDTERNMLADIIREGTHAFDFPFQLHLKRRADQRVGCEQLIKNYLEIFLIQLLRRMESNISVSAQDGESLSSKAKERNDDVITQTVVQYLKDNLHTQVSIAQICSQFHISKSQLTYVFKKKVGQSIVEYFTDLKIDQAKLLIREQNSNFTEISNTLGFSSIHYFSKIFKRRIGMTPSEYAKSVLARK